MYFFVSEIYCAVM